MGALMIINKLHLVYFSPTGTGKANLEFAANNFNIETIKHDITCKSETLNFEDNDLVFFITPVYSGRIPNLAKKRLEKIRGNNTLCVLFSVYGNRAFDDSLIELQQIVEKNDFITVAGLGVIGQHTFSKNVATNRPTEEDSKIITENMEIIKQKLKKIDNINDIKKLILPGTIPTNQAKRLSLTPKINNNCINCNICIDVCPTHAITLEHFSSPDPNLCIGCLACVKHCPNHARHVNPVKIGALAKAMELACKKHQEISLYI
jgi:ferredoxin